MPNDPIYPRSVGRRAVLLGMAGILPAILFKEAAAQQPSSCPTAKRVAVMTPWITETIQAMGVMPIAVPEAQRDRRAGQSRLPDSVVDLGFMGEPNLEQLDRLRPDLILIDGTLQGEGWKRIMSDIAPVEMVDLFLPARNPWRTTGEQALLIADWIGCPDAGPSFLVDSDATIARARQVIAGTDAASRPWFLARMNDARNFTLHAEGSIFHDVLTMLGLTDACTVSSQWGFLGVGIDKLAELPDAGIILLNAPPPGAAQGMGPDSLWQQLPAVREGRVHYLDDLYMFGAIPTGVQFARQLVESLTGEGLA